MYVPYLGAVCTVWKYLRNRKIIRNLAIFKFAGFRWGMIYLRIPYDFAKIRSTPTSPWNRFYGIRSCKSYFERHFLLNHTESCPSEKRNSPMTRHVTGTTHPSGVALTMAISDQRYNQQEKQRFG